MRTDVFICHATEDKVLLARPLAEELRRRGHTVRFDEYSLVPGDSLVGAIDAGLALCRYGVLILSPDFFAKRWTQREYRGLVTRQLLEGRSLLIPVWFNVDAQAIARYSPPLADIAALDFRMGLDAVAGRISQLLETSPETHAVNATCRVLVGPGSNPEAVVYWSATLRALTELAAYEVPNIAGSGQLRLSRGKGGHCELCPEGAKRYVGPSRFQSNQVRSSRLARCFVRPIH